MKRGLAAWMMGAVVVAGTVAQTSPAVAGPINMRDASKGHSAVGGGRSNAQRVNNDRSSHGRENNSRSRGTSRGNTIGNGSSATPLLDAWRNAAGNRSNQSDHPILDALQNRARDYNGYGNGYGYGNNYRNDHHHNDDFAGAYRDAAIANAVVNLVGIAVGAAVQHQAYATPVVVAPAPVQVVEVQPQPRGYYRTEQILVSPGHYEDVRVWEPECRDAYGHMSGGYYVVSKRWIPEVYEYRPVWVQQ